MASLLLLFLAVVIGVAGWRWLRPLPVPPESRPPAPTIDQIRQLAVLVTTEIAISDVLQTTLRGYLGYDRAILIVKGEVLLGPDLRQARIISIDEDHRRLELRLLPPTVLSARLDHDGTRLVELGRGGLWLLVPGDAGRTRTVNLAFEEAQAALERAGANEGCESQARRRTEQVLERFGQTLGWQISVRWGP